MKFTILFCFLFLYVANLAGGQDLKRKELSNGLRVFIEGAKDTIVSDQKVFSIDLSLIANGFRLRLSDTTYQIQSFLLSFDSKCCINSLQSVGDEIIPRNDSIVRFDQIVESTMISLDNIRVFKNNESRKLPSQIYYVVRKEVNF